MTLKPWREVASPHPDVAKGRYQQAEFAADLAQVAREEGEIEYRDPIEFFARTYLTDGMRRLLVTTLERLSGKGGEPVVQLKTAFGGGKEGKAVLARIEHIFKRLETIWKPVSATEGFEIVRRRLFSPIKDEAARDEVCRAFSRLYDENSGDFPQECREGVYLDRLRQAYPIHPELFDRLYDDWSSLESFQRTRGVLRLMAAAIHDLWVRNDCSLLILPGIMPLDGQRVKDELLGYLPDGWNGKRYGSLAGKRTQ